MATADKQYTTALRLFRAAETCGHYQLYCPGGDLDALHLSDYSGGMSKQIRQLAEMIYPTGHDAGLDRKIEMGRIIGGNEPNKFAIKVVASKMEDMMFATRPQLKKLARELRVAVGDVGEIEPDLHGIGWADAVVRATGGVTGGDSDAD